MRDSPTVKNTGLATVRTLDSVHAGYGGSRRVTGGHGGSRGGHGGSRGVTTGYGGPPLWAWAPPHIYPSSYRSNKPQDLIKAGILVFITGKKRKQKSSVHSPPPSQPHYGSDSQGLNQPHYGSDSQGLNQPHYGSDSQGLIDMSELRETLEHRRRDTTLDSGFRVGFGDDKVISREPPARPVKPNRLSSASMKENSLPRRSVSRSQMDPLPPPPVPSSRPPTNGPLSPMQGKGLRKGGPRPQTVGVSTWRVRLWHVWGCDTCETVTGVRLWHVWGCDTGWDSGSNVGSFGLIVPLIQPPYGLLHDKLSERTILYQSAWKIISTCNS